MPTFEVAGPDPDGEYWVVRIEMKGTVRHDTSLPETYATAEDAQGAADAFNADPDSAPVA